MDVRSRSLPCPVKMTLAGVGVPYFYGAGYPVLEERRAIVPPVLVIEYISNAVSLQNFQDREDISSITAWLVKALDDNFVRMNKAAVTHQDVGLPDILIGPSQAVVVGFRGEEDASAGADECARGSEEGEESEGRGSGCGEKGVKESSWDGTF